MARLMGGVVAAAALLIVFGTRATGLPPLGTLLDPQDGLYRMARGTGHDDMAESLSINGLSGPVEVIRDDRGVPHIFAQSDRDAVIALGYVVAQDRLFQLDFLPRVASGRLAEALGPTLVETDRFLRSTGMEWGAQKNWARIEARRGVEYDLLTWYAEGVNAYLDGLGDEDLPFEFRLLGYTPDRYTPIQTLRLMQYMAYDLSYGTDDADYGRLTAALTPDDYRTLYPRYAELFVPIIPALGGGVLQGGTDVTIGAVTHGTSEAAALLAARSAFQARLRGTPMEGSSPARGRTTGPSPLRVRQRGQLSSRATCTSR